VSLVVVIETIRRHFAHLGYIAVLLILIVIVVLMTAIGAPPGAPYALIGLFTLVAGCQLIGPEFSSGTLQLILSKPIGRSSYLTGRVVGVVLSIWVGVAIILCSDVIGRLIAGTPIVWRTVLWTALVSALKVLLTCSLLALFGSFTRSYVNIGIYLGGQILLSGVYGLLSIMRGAASGEMAAIGRLLRAHPGVLEGYRLVESNLFPDDPMTSFDRNWILMMTCNAVVAVLLACVIFSRREVPYGAD
jgi:ABC-type transport system involved in multi-copper enzyme maturation permease subunit